MSARRCVNVALAGDEPEPAEALSLSGRVDLDDISRPVHSAAYVDDLSRARYQSGDCEGTLDMLLEAEADQPERIKSQALAAVTVRKCWKPSAR